MAAVTDEYLADRFRLALPYDHVIPALASLRRRYVLGLATNRNSCPDRVGLAGYFSFAAFAHECGYRKPDLRFFDTVRRAAAHQPSEIVYVGDSLDEDIAGAQGAGFRAVWLNRERAPNPPAITPDATITSLSQLPTALAALA